MNEQNIKRIIVAVEPTEINRSILQAATSLASQLDAELNALFVEDINLLKLAELPFAREIAYGASSGRQINLSDMERAIRSQTAHLRNLIQNMAQQHQIKIDFDVLRGNIAEELCLASQHADLLILGKSTQLLRHGEKIGSVTRAVLTSANCNLLVLQHETTLDRPVAVFYTGDKSSQHALRFAMQLAHRDHHNLMVILPACSKDEGSRLKSEVCNITEGYAADIPVIHLKENTADSIIDVLENSDAKVLVLQMKNKYLDEKQLLYLIEKNKFPIILSPKDHNE